MILPGVESFFDDLYDSRLFYYLYYLYDLFFVFIFVKDLFLGNFPNYCFFQYLLYIFAGGIRSVLLM